MTDTLTKAERSERMSRIRGKDTGPELALRRALHRLGFRYRLHDKRLPGRPDMVLPRYQTVVLVHGCFWHRHAGCPIATTPKSNTPYWLSKFTATTARDERNIKALRKLGWRVVIAWECELNTLAKAERTAARLAKRFSYSPR